MGAFAMLFVFFFVLVGMHGMADAELPSNRKVTPPLSDKKDAKDPPSAPKRTRWAVVMAGSRRFWNYRHQSDVCHAYHLLKARGFDDDHVITLVFDDIAHSFWQPTRYYGQIFNRPGGEDVYKGCAKDYTRYDVTADNFYAVLRGDKEAVKGVGSGRVIEATENDDIFIFYSDHGSPGLIGTPYGRYIWADEFNKVIAKMAEDKKFNEMVIYMESCEAGSMFEGLLKNDTRVYALAAANATESSWATYCRDVSTMSSPKPSDLGTCMGDLFSTKWMEDSERTNPLNESLHEQFVLVAKATGRIANHGYGSEVCQYGNITIDKESVSEFMVDEDPVELDAEFGDSEDPEDFLAKFERIEQDDPLMMFANYLPTSRKHVDQRDADLVFFMQRASLANDLSEQDLMLGELRKRVVQRRKADENIRAVVGSLLMMQNTDARPMPNYFGAEVERMVTHDMGRPGSGKPVVDDFDCLRGMMTHWEDRCGRVMDYSMKYSRTFANLCNEGISVDEFVTAVASVCDGRSEVEKEAEDFLEASRSHSTTRPVVVS